MLVNKEDLYTLRWYVQRFPDNQDREDALGLLARLLGEAPKPEPVVVTDTSHTGGRIFDTEPIGLLECPFATQFKRRARARGKYPKGYPEGAIVHFTAGRETQTLQGAVDYQVSQGYLYFVIDPDGNIGQNFSLDEHGYHAGESYWTGLGKYVSNRVVGIEVLCPGNLDAQRRPWFSKTPYSPDQCRVVRKEANRQAGTYFAYTEQQEASLLRLVCWLKLNNPDVFKVDYVLGHDEVSGPAGLGWARKCDPGGSLSVTMPEFRNKVAALTK